MDIVFIHNLRADAVIGIYEWERQVKQTLCIDLEMATDIRQAAATDQVEYAINYKTVSDRLIEFVAQRQAQLIETLAEEIAQLLLNDFSIAWVRVKISKPTAVKEASAVGVIIERGDKAAMQP